MRALLQRVTSARVDVADRTVGQIGPGSVAQVVLLRWAAGSTPSALRISQTVEEATLIPRVASLPCTRRYPQFGFSLTRRRTRARMERTVGGRPGRLGRQLRA